MGSCHEKMYINKYNISIGLGLCPLACSM